MIHTAVSQNMIRDHRGLDMIFKITNQLHTLIDQQLQRIPTNSLNMVERLNEIIDEQNEWLGASVNNDAQVGRGPSNDDDYDPSAPDMGLTSHFIDRLISE